MREEVYIAQLKALGIWQDAFLPVVKDLSKAERRRTRAEKEWSATVPKGGKPSFTHPLYQTVVQLDRMVMEYREALGLTPKALRKLRGVEATADAGPTSGEMIAERLDALLAREDYGAWDFEKIEAAVSGMAMGTPSVTSVRPGDSSLKEGACGDG